MWHHFCPSEGTVLGVADGEPCNWCDTPQTPPDDAQPTSDDQQKAP